LTCSGIIQVRQLDGLNGALQLRVATDPADSDFLDPTSQAIVDAASSYGTASPPLLLPANFTAISRSWTLSQTIFPSPVINVSAEYDADGKWTFLNIGDTDAISDSSGTQRLYGNYGATYKIKYTLTNPTTTAKTIALYFVPHAGLAAGVFRIDNGPVLEFDPIDLPEERELARYVLLPGEKRVVNVCTLPLNGGAYPISITAHEL